jgi:putative membrane protein
MTATLISLLANGLAVFLTAYFLKGVTVKNYLHALLTAIVLALANTFLYPILLFLTIPITIVTLGLFLIVINAVIIMLVAALLPGFRVDGFFWAVAFSLVLWVVNTVLRWVLPIY